MVPRSPPNHATGGNAGSGSPVGRAVSFVSAVSSRSDPLDTALRVTVHFHPDRVFSGEPILQAMARDGVYRSQFETLTSNGGLTANQGREGARWKWESRIFGGVYDDAPASQRPRYGALDHLRRTVGGSPRFGSAHLRLAPHTLARTTFCFPDSYHEPRDFGVAACMPLITLVEAHRLNPPTGWDPLDTYIEAHIHGPIRFDHDVEALVLDPSHRATDTHKLAAALPCPVEWHEGFRVCADTLRANLEYCGREYVDLALSLAQGGWLTPRMIGDAARTGLHNEQALKRVWHYLARFGAPDAPA